MYGRGAGILSTAVVTGTTTAAGGATALPYTSGNMLGTILAVTAITFGLGIICSQIVVRILRNKYQK